MTLVTRLLGLLIVTVTALLAGSIREVMAADWGLAPLLADIAASSAGKARFVERKFIAALDAPVDSSGELQFVKPARLEKRTLKPRAETLILDGDEMVVERGGSRRVFSLKQIPEALPMVESLRATLAGDRATLERVFVVALDGSAARWNLTLKPKDAAGANLLKEVRISGERGEPNLIEVDQSNGDRSVLRVLR